MSNLRQRETRVAIGSTLRDARVQRGLTIDQVAQDTRISARFLEALEAEMFDQLPAPVYVRGFLRSYANYLHVDSQPLLEELALTGGAGLSGPDGFVRGPSRPTPRGRSADPFGRTPPPMPEPSVVVEGEEESETEKDEWQPETTDVPVARDGQREPFVVAPPTPAGSEEYEEAEDYHPRRVEGILSERETVYNEGTGGMRLLAIAGGAGIIVLFIVVVAMLMGGGGDQKQANAAETPSPTAARGQGTVITVGSATAAPSASPSPNASASPSPSGTPTSPTPDATSTPATATPTRAVVVPATPTPTPTDEPTPTPGPKISVTPYVPTATPVVAPTFGYGECPRAGDGTPNCPLLSTYRIVCSPTGWFLDLDPQWAVPNNVPGWRVVVVPGPSQTKVNASACN